MSRHDKLVARFQSKPKDFTWNELTRLLEGLGYNEVAPRKTGGSRRRFIHTTAPTIALHKPHPGNIVKRYAMVKLVQLLNEEDLL